MKSLIFWGMCECFHLIHRSSKQTLIKHLTLRAQCEAFYLYYATRWDSYESIIVPIFAVSRLTEKTRAELRLTPHPYSKVRMHLNALWSFYPSSPCTGFSMSHKMRMMHGSLWRHVTWSKGPGGPGIRLHPWLVSLAPPCPRDPATGLLTSEVPACQCRPVEWRHVFLRIWEYSNLGDSWPIFKTVIPKEPLPRPPETSPICARRSIKHWQVCGFQEDVGNLCNFKCSKTCFESSSNERSKAPQASGWGWVGVGGGTVGASGSSLSSDSFNLLGFRKGSKSQFRNRLK